MTPHYTTEQPLNRLGDHQLAWATSVGWGHHAPLEDLALLASEVGEAINECRDSEFSAAFAEEMADIVLRAVGIARKYGVDLDAQVARKQAINQQRGNRGRAK